MEDKKIHTPLSESKPQEPSQSEKELIEMSFGGGRKLSTDFVNAYTALYTRSFAGEIDFENLQKIPTYREYFQNSEPKSVSYVMELSNPDAVTILDNMISVFNNDLERIKSEKDIETIKKILKNINDFIRKRN